MEEVLSIAARAADSKASVLIKGESGTGKELLAKAIHYSSPRKDKPFVAVNCAALNENLLESELFGHEKGAFTGADKQRIGRFELADGGTLFLDEIGDLPLSTQVKLLRVLQEHSFERVGSSNTISVDVRVLAATNRDLSKMMAEGRFRDDLFYRLNVITIDIPPLHERKEDIKALVEFFMQKFTEDSKRKRITFSKEAYDSLIRYDFPGNVRELENMIHRAIVLSRKGIITEEDIFYNIKHSEREESEAADTMKMNEQVERLEKNLVIKALEETKGNQTQAAKLLGISERNLRYRLNKWGFTNLIFR
jgi:two-component system NtrC family response regulator